MSCSDFFSQQTRWPADGWLRYPFSLLNIEFMLGVLAAWVVKSWSAQCRHSYGWGWVVVSGVFVACLGIALISGESSPYSHLLFAFGLTLLIIGFAIREQSSKLYWLGLFLLMGN